MKIFIIKNLWWVTFSIASLLLVAHSFKITNLSVDSTSILLLVIMLISPFVTAIRKIKFGEFEAEIDPKEIQKIKSEAEKNIDFTPQGEGEQPEINKATLSIKELAESDLVLALAKTRIELEKILSKIAQTSSIEIKRIPLGVLAKKLSNLEIITPGVASSLQEVIGICNRAIHGEVIAEGDAQTIIELGIELIDDLYWLYKEQAVTGPIVSEEVVDSALTQNYYDNRKIFRLTSIIPLVERPKRIVRELNQDQLNEYLEYYNEYAEFIIELVEIKNG